MPFIGTSGVSSVSLQGISTPAAVGVALTASSGLEVAGPLRISAATGTNWIEMYNTTAGALKWIQYISGNNLLFYDSTNSANQFTFEAGGNLGIGSDAINPGYRLDIACGAVTGDGVRISSTLANAGRISLTSSHGSGRNWDIRNGNAADGRFSIEDATAGSVRLVIDSSGNVGIGTAGDATLGSKLVITGPIAGTTSGTDVSATFRSADGVNQLVLGPSNPTTRVGRIRAEAENGSTRPFTIDWTDGTTVYPIIKLAQSPFYTAVGEDGRSVVLAGDDNAQLAHSATNGFVYFPTIAGNGPGGIPSGTPVTIGAAAYHIPFVMDPTNNKLWAYYGSAWHYASFT